MKIIIIGCGKSKANPAEINKQLGLSRSKYLCPARHLYTGSLFRKRLAYAESRAPHQIHILSAWHRLLPLNAPLRPYDFTVRDMNKLEKMEWAMSVVSELLQLGLNPPDPTIPLTRPNEMQIELHASRDYIFEINALLMIAGCHVEKPVEGLGIGEQMKWYTERNAVTL